MKEGKVKPIEKPYIPTRAEERLLDILMDPASRFRTVKDNCAVAKVNQEIYYKAMNKPGFCKVYRERTTALFIRALAPVIYTMDQRMNRLIYEVVCGYIAALTIGLESSGLYEKHEHFADEDVLKWLLGLVSGK